MKRLNIVVIGTLASDPYAGMAWMNMQITVGLQRLGHNVYYFETTSSWPYDPIKRSHVDDSSYAVTYLHKVAKSFDLGGRWAYRQSYSDKGWFGLSQSAAEDLLAHADVVFNIAGATRLAEEGLTVGRLVHFGTDPVYQEIAYSNGDQEIRRLVDEHDECVTYGENIGNPDCPIPPLPNLHARTRQPVLIDLWEAVQPSRDVFTTVCNWEDARRSIDFLDETYSWSKHQEFLKFIDLPLQVDSSIELATGLDAISRDDRSLLAMNRWQLRDAHEFTTDPWPYRDYIRSSAGEFTVAKDQNVRLRSGWFSERSACYLAAGRPVITQDTGFGKVLPTGDGLFAFNTMDDIVVAFDAIASDYQKHRRAARSIAEEYFRAETVMGRLLLDLGL